MGSRVGYLPGRVAEVTLGASDHEHFFTTARLVLALVCAAALLTKAAYAGGLVLPTTFAVLSYLAYSLARFQVSRGHRAGPLVWAVRLHCLEIVLVSAIATASGGAKSPFLELYVFVLFVSAVQWGFNGAVLTAFGCSVWLFADLALPHSWAGSSLNGLSGTGSVIAAMALSAGLISTASLLGLLVEWQQGQSSDARTIKKLLHRVLPEQSFYLTLRDTLISVRDYLGAERVQLAVQEIRGERAFAWEVTPAAGQDGSGIQFWRLTELARCACFATPPDGLLAHLEHGFGGVNDGPRLGASGKNLSLRAPLPSLPLPPSNGTYGLQVATEQHPARAGSPHSFAASFLFEGKWQGKLTIYRPSSRRRVQGGSRFLADLVRDVGPVLYSKYLVGRLRSRVQAVERRRIAHDLHDHLIQSLIAMEMEMELLRRTQAPACDPAYVLEELRRLQLLLHNEILKARDEMRRHKPLEVNPRSFLPVMAETVDRFRRETGITAAFASDCEETEVSSRIATEVVRILQEALVNARKHSGARTVNVRYSRADGRRQLSIADDGGGFGIAGRFSLEELESLSRGPALVMERVRSIGGGMLLESEPASGSRVTILLPD